MQQSASNKQSGEKRTASDLLRIVGVISLAVAVLAGGAQLQFHFQLGTVIAFVAFGVGWLCLAGGLASSKKSGNTKLWGGMPWALLASWVVLVVTLALGVMFALDPTAIIAVGIVAVAGLWLWSLLAWGGYMSAALWALSLVLAAASVAGLWVLGNGGWAIALAVVQAAVSVGGWWLIYGRVKTRAEIVWLATGLAPATGDDRPTPAILSPSWGRAHGLPITWNYPPSLTPDDRRRAELDRVISDRLNTPARVEWKATTATILPVAAKAPRDGLTEDVESVLTSMLPEARVTELDRSDDGSGAISRVEFTWPPKVTKWASSPAYQGRVAKALQAAIGKPLTVSFDTATRVGTAVPLTPLPDIVPHPPRNEAEPMKVAFGQFRDGRAAVWDLDAPLPHLLINGGTGGGKTILILSILLGLPLGRVTIRAIDPKRVGLYNLRLIPGAQNAATSETSIAETLLAVKAEMDRRYAFLETEGPHLRETLDSSILVIDEGEEMADILNDWWNSGDGKEWWQQRFGLEKKPTGTTHPLMKVLGSILRLGREARVHVILASQQAAASWLSTSSRGQFAVRIALRNLDTQTSIMLFGSPIATSGLENLPGRAWVSLGMGVPPEHAQIFWTPKLQSGHTDTDREILHQLGITLPDDADFGTPTPEPAPVRDEPDEAPIVFDDELDEAPIVFDDEPSSESPRLHEAQAAAEPAAVTVADLEDDDPAESIAADDGELLDLPVLSVEDGMRILVEIDGVSVPAIVEDLEPDEDEPDYLNLTYRTDDGELGVISLSDDDTVPTMAAVNA